MDTTREAMAGTVPVEWYALHTRSRHEKSIAARLHSQDMETFLPLRRSQHLWKNGVHADVDLPLFPCYLFARVGAHDRLRLLQTPGVLGFAATSARPTAIPDDEIALLRTATAKFIAEPHPYLNCGDRVRIVAGPMAGLDGNPGAAQAGVPCRAIHRGHHAFRRSRGERVRDRAGREAEVNGLTVLPQTRGSCHL